MSKRNALLLLIFALPAGAQTAATPTLVEALTQARAPLVLDHGQFSGPGSEVLTRAVGESRYVLVGEDHLTQEIPAFTAALCDVMHPDAYAVEAGPEAARFVNGLLRDPNRVSIMAARMKTHPNNMAFLDMQPENDLAAHCGAASKNRNFALWGLDQEFMGAAGTQLEAMLATKPGPLSQSAIRAAQSKEQAADRDARASGDPAKLYLFSITDADLNSLTTAIAADGNQDTKTLAHELLVSREIYRLNAEGSPESNNQRAQLMKQHFLGDYAALKTQTLEPRILFKFGDFHTGKGFNAIHQLDLGNFVAELAAGEGAKSLHILVLGARGTHASFAGYARPLGREPFVMTDDPDYKWLAPAVASLLPSQAGQSGSAMTLFDLRQLRFRGVDLSPDWERAVYAYDLFVLIPELTPAAAIQEAQPAP